MITLVRIQRIARLPILMAAIILNLSFARGAYTESKSPFTHLVDSQSDTLVSPISDDSSVHGFGPLTGIAHVYVGYDHTCVVTIEGNVKCWGDNISGQLGNGKGEYSDIPVDVVELDIPITSVVAGNIHTCALGENGEVRCWGNNGSGQLGNASSDSSRTPVKVEYNGKFNSLVAGAYHTCGLTESGRVKCWGSNSGGQLGNGDPTVGFSNVPIDVNGLTSSVTVIASNGGRHTCALLDTGTVKCWGANGDHQLGDSTTKDSFTPLDVQGISADIRSIAVGSSHSCALNNRGGVKCWGYNTFGQLGDGTTEYRLGPVDVIALGSVVADIVAGGQQTCAVMAAGALKCWGNNNLGQLGDGTFHERNVPTDISELTNDISWLATGRRSTCAVTKSATLKCWGITLSHLTRSIIPVDVVDLSDDIEGIAAGEDHTCAFSDSGIVSCWGINSHGQLGISDLQRSGIPLNVDAISGSMSLKHLALGYEHTCILLANEGPRNIVESDSELDGRVKCWGHNWRGQLGNGTIESTSEPVTAIGLNDATSLSSGGAHTCATTADGGAKCWGSNVSGQLGIDDGIITSTVPIAVRGLNGQVLDIEAGYAHTCALSSTEGVLCWGWNIFGQLASPDIITSSIPISIKGLDEEIVDINVGSFHACALTASGGVKCWGNNGDGRLGDGTDAKRLKAVDVAGLGSGVKSISSQGEYSCALMNDYGVKCWGSNFTTSNLLPVDVIGLAGNAISIAVGDNHACALVGLDESAQRKVQCWGVSMDGQLGNGVTPNHRGRYGYYYIETPTDYLVPTVCYSLSFTISGSGTIPTTVPAQSTGCEPGEFNAAEEILLVSNPTPETRITTWQGSSQDSISASTNKLFSMPATDYEIHVTYGEPVRSFLPFMAK